MIRATRTFEDTNPNIVWQIMPPHKFVLSNKNYIPATLKMSRMVKVVKTTHDSALDMNQGRKISDSIFEFVRTSKKTNKITFHHP